MAELTVGQAVRLKSGRTGTVRQVVVQGLRVAEGGFQKQCGQKLFRPVGHQAIRRMGTTIMSPVGLRPIWTSTP